MRKCFEKNAHLLKGVKDKKVSEHNRCLFCVCAPWTRSNGCKSMSDYYTEKCVTC